MKGERKTLKRIDEENWEKVEGKIRAEKEGEMYAPEAISDRLAFGLMINGYLMMIGQFVFF